MSAPICHVPPPDTTIPQPGVRALPAIPVAQPNLQSLMATVNALRQTVNILTGQQGINGANNAKSDNKGQWVEDRRTTEVVKVYNPDDRSQFIEVERINRLVMKDKGTNQTWTWTR
jgi:hypothetical protein